MSDDTFKMDLILRISKLDHVISEMENIGAEIGLNKEELSHQSVYAAAVSKRHTLKVVLATLMKRKKD